MKYINYILVAVLFMGTATVSMASDKSDDASKSDKKSALQKTTEGAAKGIAKGFDNLVDGIKQMPGAISKAAKKIEKSDDEK